MKRYLLLIIGLVWAAVSGVRAEGDLQDQVVVLANANVPDSVVLARYYMRKREIPPDNLCVLDLPASEDISRSQYEIRLRDPLIQFLRKNKLVKQTIRKPRLVQRHEVPWHTRSTKVSTVVSMYGVPLRIIDLQAKILAVITDKLSKPAYKDLASVDSELSMLLYPPYNLRGPHANPVRGRFFRNESSALANLIVMATRLDGPDPESVRRMIDDAVAMERYGLLGRAYFDIRGLKLGAYYAGDHWIREAYERFVREGFECVIDVSENLFPDAYPMEDAVYYMGWYTTHVSGPFKRPNFAFKPGAIAYHLHSGAAKSLKNPERNWAGPFIARGVTGTMGAVFEPFLAQTIEVDLFTERICMGYSFAESATMALPSLSWQMSIIGDPLYRPFHYPLEQQIRHMREDSHPGLEWGYLRKVNLLVRDGQFNKGLDFCRRAIHETGSLVLREKLADLYAMNNLYDDAEAEYQKVVKDAGTAATAVRAGRRLMRLHRVLGRDERAEAVAQAIREQWPDDPMLAWLEGEGVERLSTR